MEKVSDKIQYEFKIISTQNFQDPQNENFLLYWFDQFIITQRVVRVLELAGGVMDELSNPSGPRKEFVNNHCGEFMQLIKVSPE